MQKSLFFLLALLGLYNGPALSQRSGARFPLNVVASAIVGAEAQFGSIVAATVGPSGNVYAVDHVNCAVFAFSPAGRMLWKVGRKGGGPGEYQLPYRIAATPTGSLLVFDLATGDVTTLSQDGRFVSRSHLPLKFPYVDDIAASGGDLLVSGYTSDPGRAHRHGVHRFRTAGGRLAHVGSFGPLPTVRDTAVLRFWGAGDITRAANGDVLFALALPYVLYRFDPAGRQKAAVRVPIRVRGTPDDAIKVERDGPAMNVSATEAVVDRPATLVEMANGWMLVSRVNSRARYWDLFTAAGGFAGSREFPREWGAAVAYDRVRGLLWMVGTHDDAPVLVRLQVTSGTATPSRRGR